MNIEERRTIAEPIEVLEDVRDVHLGKSNPEGFTRIRTSMEEKTKQDLIQFLKKSTNVFAWSHEELPKIDPSVITYHLNVSPSYKPVYQKRRVFAPEWDNAIIEEVQKLVIAEFIREVYYPDWLANVVMVKKTSDEWTMCMDFTNLNKAYINNYFSSIHINRSQISSQLTINGSNHSHFRLNWFQVTLIKRKLHKLLIE